jgi:hypothetical protein
MNLEIFRLQFNYAFLFLDTGHIGRTYFKSRENDRVALLARSDVPFLLREVEDGQDRYRVVRQPTFMA